MNTVVHSDRGSQVRSKAFVQTSKHKGLSRVNGAPGGARGDEAALLAPGQRPRPPTLGDEKKVLRLAIFTWIERTHHRRRRQSAPGRLTPVEFEPLEPAPRHPSDELIRPP